jgi:hypothetical protein
MQSTSDRREFLKAAAGPLALLLSRHGLTSAQARSIRRGVRRPAVGFGVIGLGVWGREILAALGRILLHNVDTICDIYQPLSETRGGECARRADGHDWRRVVESRGGQLGRHRHAHT